MTSSIQLCLSLVILQLICYSVAQDVHVACYESSSGGGGGGEDCSPALLLDSAQSYSECCTEGQGSSTRRYILDPGQLQCATCGPVLDEALFFPKVSDLDPSTIFIHWGLQSDSIPASRYVLLVGKVSEGEAGLTAVSVPVLDPSIPPTRQQFAPVTPGEVYSIGIRAVDDSDVSSPVTRVVWRAGDDILPSFTDFEFSVSVFSPTGTACASWSVLNPGLRPIHHITVQWVESSAVQAQDDLTDPASPAYPLANIAIMEYDVWNESQVLTQGRVITLELRGLVEGEAYFAAVTGTNVLGSSTTLFQFTAEVNDTTTEPAPTGTSGDRPATVPISVMTVLLVSLTHFSV